MSIQFIPVIGYSHNTTKVFIGSLSFRGRRDELIDILTKTMDELFCKKEKDMFVRFSGGEPFHTDSFWLENYLHVIAPKDSTHVHLSCVFNDTEIKEYLNLCAKLVKYLSLIKAQFEYVIRKPYIYLVENESSSSEPLIESTIDEYGYKYIMNEHICKEISSFM
jgi:hypothetical protein